MVNITSSDVTYTRGYCWVMWGCNFRLFPKPNIATFPSLIETQAVIVLSCITYDGKWWNCYQHKTDTGGKDTTGSTTLFSSGPKKWP